MNKIIAWFKGLFIKIPPTEIPSDEPKKEENNPPVILPAPIPDYLIEARKQIGSDEDDPSFNKKMTAKWSLFGLSIPSIRGSSYAWCGLWVATILAAYGFQYQKNGALAGNWRSFGNSVNWMVDGIPPGAIVHINHNENCAIGSSSNHVTIANGACAAKDIVQMIKDKDGVYRVHPKPGAMFDGLGGNQDNKVQVKAYPVEDICEVRFPKELQLPKKIETSDHCVTGKSSGGSTR